MRGSRALVATLLLLLSACQTQQTRQGEGPAGGRGFQVQDLAKSDIDMASEIQQGYLLELWRELSVKLYRRNPREWRKAGLAGEQQALDRLYSQGARGGLPELKGARSIAAMELAFRDDYTGDRVLALLYGLHGMLLDAYNGKREFFLTDELDPQKLYNSARNLEIMAWRLGHRLAADGRPFLISSSSNGRVDNLSFERLFGKMIATQDGLARVIAQRSNRRLKNVIQTMASAVFLPI